MMNRQQIRHPRELPSASEEPRVIMRGWVRHIISVPHTKSHKYTKAFKHLRSHTITYPYNPIYTENPHPHITMEMAEDHY